MCVIVCVIIVCVIVCVCDSVCDSECVNVATRFVFLCSAACGPTRDLHGACSPFAHKKRLTPTWPAQSARLQFIKRFFNFDLWSCLTFLFFVAIAPFCVQAWPVIVVSGLLTIGKSLTFVSPCSCALGSAAAPTRTALWLQATPLQRKPRAIWTCTRQAVSQLVARALARLVAPVLCLAVPMLRVRVSNLTPEDTRDLFFSLSRELVRQRGKRVCELFVLGRVLRARTGLCRILVRKGGAQPPSSRPSLTIVRPGTSRRSNSRPYRPSSVFFVCNKRPLCHWNWLDLTQNKAPYWKRLGQWLT